MVCLKILRKQMMSKLFFCTCAPITQQDVIQAKKNGRKSSKSSRERNISLPLTMLIKDLPVVISIVMPTPWDFSQSTTIESFFSNRWPRISASMVRELDVFQLSVEMKRKQMLSALGWRESLDQCTLTHQSMEPESLIPSSTTQSLQRAGTDPWKQCHPEWWTWDLGGFLTWNNTAALMIGAMLLVKLVCSLSQESMENRFKNLEINSVSTWQGTEESLFQVSTHLTSITWRSPSTQ